jgi:glycosyltransferase involved in cell wall biosynthesis
MYLVNKSNRIVEVDDEKLTNELIKKHGCRVATPKEIQSHAVSNEEEKLVADTVYLVNPSGVVVEISDKKLYASCMKMDGFREATPEEIIIYRQDINPSFSPEETILEHTNFQDSPFFKDEADADIKNEIMMCAVAMKSPNEYMRIKRFLGGIRSNNPEIYLQSVTSFPDGYGQSSDMLHKACIRTGMRMSRNYTNQEIGLLYSYPYGLENMRNSIKFIYTMFESTTIPKEWIPYLQMATKVFVPSKFCQKAFATRDIKSEVIPLGYDSRAFTYKEKEKKVIDKKHPFVFLHYDAFNTRKGWDIVFKAFNEEFKPDEPVKLIMKTIKTELPFPIIKSQYPNIQVIKQEYSKKQLVDLIQSSDCFVFPSRGEGFGLTPLENLACGTPSIIPNASGMSEYFNSRYFYEVKVDKLVPALYSNKQFDARETGQMIEPSMKDLCKKMRYAYNHREDGYDMARRGARWVKRYSIDNTAKLLKQAITKSV